MTSEERDRVGRVVAHLSGNVGPALRSAVLLWWSGIPARSRDAAYSRMATVLAGYEATLGQVTSPQLEPLNDSDGILACSVAWEATEHPPQASRVARSAELGGGVPRGDTPSTGPRGRGGEVRSPLPLPAEASAQESSSGLSKEPPSPKSTPRKHHGSTTEAPRKHQGSTDRFRDSPPLPHRPYVRASEPHEPLPAVPADRPVLAVIAGASHVLYAPSALPLYRVTPPEAHEPCWTCGMTGWRSKSQVLMQRCAEGEPVGYRQWLVHPDYRDTAELVEVNVFIAAPGGRHHHRWKEAVDPKKVSVGLDRGGRAWVSSWGPEEVSVVAASRSREKAEAELGEYLARVRAYARWAHRTLVRRRA